MELKDIYIYPFRCSLCDCLVPDLVMEEHRETCWANNRNKRRIQTPMERRKAKFPKERFHVIPPNSSSLIR